MKKRNIAFRNRIKNEECKLCMEVISDLHITLPRRSKKLDHALHDMWKRKIKYVALVGDLSNNGYPFQLKSCLQNLQEYPMQYVIALGNHDTYNLFYKQQIKIHPLYKQIALKQQTSLYYDRIICGIHMYVLNSELPCKDGCYYSEKQCQWLAENLAKDDKNKPVFIFSHHPLSMACASCDSSQSLPTIIKQHPHTIYISGHMHHGYSACEVSHTDTTYTIEVPSFTKIQMGEKREQIGYHLQIYHDFIYIKSRDYASSTWITSNSFIIDLHHCSIFRFVD